MSVIASKQSLQELMNYSHKEVASLLVAYKNYSDLAMQIASGVITQPVKKFSFSENHGTMTNFSPLADAQKKLEQIGGAMKFQNPMIWLLYKESAYRDEPGKAIKTVGDLIRHCEVDGICYKRFDYINLYMRRHHHGKDIRSESFVDPQTPLTDFACDERFIGMCLDAGFQTTWSAHENNQGGKWRTYIPTNPDHNCEERCTC